MSYTSILKAEQNLTSIDEQNLTSINTNTSTKNKARCIRIKHVPTNLNFVSSAPYIMSDLSDVNHAALNSIFFLATLLKEPIPTQNIDQARRPRFYKTNHATGKPQFKHVFSLASCITLQHEISFFICLDPCSHLAVQKDLVVSTFSTKNKTRVNHCILFYTAAL